MEDLIYMIAIWALGLGTGLGLGTAIESQRTLKRQLAWINEDRQEGQGEYNYKG